MREQPQSHPRPGGVDWWRETELSPTSHQVNYLSSLLSITNLYGAPSRTNPIPVTLLKTRYSGTHHTRPFTVSTSETKP